jgi:DNA polymerase-1
MHAVPARLSPTHRIAITGDELAQMVTAVRAAPRRGVDFETDGLRYASGKKPIGYSLGYLGNDGVAWCWYAPFGHLTQERQANRDHARAAFHDALAGASTLVGQNLKFDINIGRADGFLLPEDAEIADSMIQAHIVYEDRPSFALESLAEQEGISPWDPTEAKRSVESWIAERARHHRLPVKRKGGVNGYLDKFGHAEVPVAIEGEYGCRDVAHALYLDRKLRPLAMGIGTAYEERRAYLYENEMLLVRALADMEWVGQPIDAPYLRNLARELDDDLAKRQAELRRLFGASIDFSNDNEVRELLYTHLKLPVVKRTDKSKTHPNGQPSVERAALMQLRVHHPGVEPLGEFNIRHKVRTTYTETLANAQDSDGRLHGSKLQHGTKTGRFAMAEPNLENIPTRHKEMARAVRRAFIVEPGKARVFGDYSQIELRMLAWTCKAPALLEAYVSPSYARLTRGEIDYDEYRRQRKDEPDTDVHSAQTRRVFGIDENHPEWKGKRRAAKIINFSVPYGGGWKMLMENPELLLPEQMARDLHGRYHEMNPEITESKRRLFAKMEGTPDCSFVNWMSRARHVPALRSKDRDIRSGAEREAFASLIQGAAAELTRLSLVRLWRARREGRIPAAATSTVHDEVQLDCDVSDVPFVMSETQRIMEDFTSYFGGTPVIVGMGMTRTTWADKEDAK